MKDWSPIRATGSTKQYLIITQCAVLQQWEALITFDTTHATEVTLVSKFSVFNKTITRSHNAVLLPLPRN